MRFKVLDELELWEHVKNQTTYPRNQWVELVYGNADPNRVEFAKGWKTRNDNKDFKYEQLRMMASSSNNPINWCRKNQVTGLLPSKILAEIKGRNMNSVVGAKCDTGSIFRKNLLFISAFDN